MHIVMLASTHPPTDARICEKEAITLVEAGHKVTILTMANGEYLAPQGITFSLVPRPANRFIRIAKSRQLLSKALELCGDIYIIHDAEILWLGRKLRNSGKTVVYDVHEPYPDYISGKKWVPTLLKPFVKKLIASEEIRGIKASDGIIAATDGILTTMLSVVEKHSKPDKPIILLHNFPRIENISLQTDAKENSIIYVGLISEHRFGEEMLRIVEKCAPGEILEGWKLNIIGPVHGKGYLERCRIAAGVHRGKPYLVFPETYMPYKQAMELVVKSRFGLSLIMPTKKYAQSLSTKVFDYMAKGTIPIATWLSAYEGLISDADGPIFIKPGEESRVPFIIADLALDEAAMRQRAELCIRTVREKFNWESEGKELPIFLEKILEKREVARKTFNLAL